MSAAAEHNRFGAGLVLLAAFALGILAGAALLHLIQFTLHRPPPMHHHGPPPPPGPPGPPPLAHLERELDLDARQVEQLREILADGRERVRGELESTGQRIRAVLTEEQRERFDAMRPPRPHRRPEPPHAPGPEPDR